MAEILTRSAPPRRSPIRRGVAWLGLLLLALAILVVPAARDARSQAPDYGRFFGVTQQAGESGAVPLHSMPVAEPAATAAAEPNGPMLSAAQKAVSQFRERLAALFVRAPSAFVEIGTTLAAASPTGRGIYFLGVVIFAALLLVTGQAVTALYAHFITRPVFIRMQRGALEGYVGKLPVLVNRVLLTIVGLGIVLAVATAVGLFFYEEHEATQLTVIVVFGSYVALYLIDTIWRMVLAPYLPRVRIPAIGDTEARQLYRWLIGATGFGVLSSAFCYWIQELGLPREVHVVVTVTLMLITVALLLMTIRTNRRTVTGMILSGQPRGMASWLQRAGAALWAPLAQLYLAGTWADLSFRLVMGIEAGPSRLLVPFVTLIAGLFVYACLVYGIERLFERQRQMRALNETAEAPAAPVEDAVEADDEGGAGERIVLIAAPRPVPDGRSMRTMEDLARRAAALIALGAGLAALGYLMAGGHAFADSTAFDTTLDVVQLVFLGYVAFHAARIWLDAKIEDEGGDVELTPGEEGGAAGATRLATLLPLVRNFILIVILTTVALILAMRLGVNVAPLFAGAGVVGLAIGFGSQTLVRDILSGAFFLLDDAFRKGEYIDVGNVKGTVEKISLRSFQLRHHLGMLHTIPFGDVQHVTNFSRDWVMMKLPLRLTYDTDVERVRKLIKKLGQRLMEDPEIGQKFLQPLKSQGVIQMEESAMIVRVKFMTRPGDQWVIRKRVFADIRALFEAEGIKFAHREVTVRIPGQAGGEAPDGAVQQAAAAAARSALDVTPLARTGTGGPVDDR